MTVVICDYWDNCEGGHACIHRKPHTRDGHTCAAICGVFGGDPGSKCVEATDEALVYYALMEALNVKD